MFNNLTDEKQKEYIKYSKLKRKFLYKQYYDVFKEKNMNTYENISSCIRYDKNLRDLLYIYLATFEESIKAYIFENYDLKNDIIDSNNSSKQLKRIKDNIVVINDEHINSLLYYHFDLDLYNIIELIYQLNICNDVEKDNLDKIRKLRNHIMHHNILVLGKSKTYNEFLVNKKELKSEIEILFEYLPNEYKQNFKNDINKLICDIDNYRIILGDENGI